MSRLSCARMLGWEYGEDWRRGDSAVFVFQRWVSAVFLAVLNGAPGDYIVLTSHTMKGL